jgi:hypothetical protein
MSRLTDLVGRTFGNLTVIDPAGSAPHEHSGEIQRLWRCSCTCGGSCLVMTWKLTSGRMWHCPDCDPPRGSDYLNNYQAYREKFTPEQRRRYERLVRSRTGWRAEAEAVDLVMRGLDI